MKLEKFLDTLAPLNMNWVGMSDLWRVPLWIYTDDNGVSGHVIAYVGIGHKRLYTPTTLPKQIKRKLALIFTVPQHSAMNNAGDHFIANEHVYRNHHYPESYDEIGWRVSEHIYTVVLPGWLIDEMRGESNGKHYTGIKGEGKG